MGDIGFIDWLDELVLIRFGWTTGVEPGVWPGLGDGLSLGDAQYLPPLSKAVTAEKPPQTIISLPVQINLELLERKHRCLSGRTT